MRLMEAKDNHAMGLCPSPQPAILGKQWLSAYLEPSVERLFSCPIVTKVCPKVKPLRGFPGGIVVKNPPANTGDIRDAVSIPGSERSRGGGRATHSSILAWRIP